ncbi:MAG: hypothetical protein AB7P52_04860 [Alphaproteobacteria bacterium]
MTGRPTRIEEPAIASPLGEGRGRMLGLGLTVAGVGAALAYYALPIFILIYGGLMPAIIAFLCDERRGRHLAITVAAFNGAGLMASLEPFFNYSLSESAAFHVVAEPSTWLLIYGFALIGWMLAWIVPLFVAHGLELIDRQRYRSTELAREAILEKWPSLGAPPRLGLFDFEAEGEEAAAAEPPPAGAAEEKISA